MNMKLNVPHARPEQKYGKQSEVDEVEAIPEDSGDDLLGR